MCIISSIFEDLLEFIEVNELYMTNFTPITGSYVILECNNKILLGFNTWRKQWELPSGGINEGENPRECAQRELYEETCQNIDTKDLIFKGLVKIFSNQKNEYKFRAVYYAKMESITPFTENNEISDIKMWTPNDKIKDYDVIDLAIIKKFFE